MEYLPAAPVQQQMILCCSCGIAIAPNPANMCVDCIRSQIDITEGIQKQMTIYFCRNCDRYLQPPNHYVTCELESRELLALCLKRLKLGKVRLVDAGFIWTEPHSKRIKVKVVIQKEVFASTILQQEFVVEYIVANQNCDECHRTAAKDHWNAVVQVRQKTDHKKTFFYLEQLIIKHRAAAKTVNIKELTDGLDFFFATKSDAVKMVDFFQNVAPIKLKTSERLISTDIQNSTANYKFTFSVEILPICKDDLVCLPQKMAIRMGNISPLCIVSRVGSGLYVIDPLTLQSSDVSNDNYWRTPFRSLCSYKQLTEFVVLNVELLGPTRGKFALADIEVARVSDFGRNDTTFITRTHLGGFLNAGDSCMGYDLTNLNANDESFDKMNAERVPYVVIIKKHYPNRRKISGKRRWQLKKLAKVQDGGITKRDEEKEEQDFEMFMRDIEEDKELRSMINLYRNEQVPADYSMPQMTEDGDYVEEDFPEVELDEMLQALTIDDPDAALAAQHAALAQEHIQSQVRDMVEEMNMHTD